MKKLLTLTFVAGALVAFGMLGSAMADDTAGVRADDNACHHKEFKTDLVKKACAEGGQKAAKKAMKGFVKAAKKATGEKINCKTCHEKLSPAFELKKDAHDNFKKFKAAIDKKAGAKKTDALERAQQIEAFLAR